MEIDNFISKPCNSSKSFEFVPKQKKALKLNEIAESFRSNNICVEVETPFLLILKIFETEVSFFKSGKIIVKSPEKAKAEKIIKRLISFL